MSGDKNRRYVSRNPATRRVLLSLLYVCPGRNCWKKVSRRKLLTYRRLLSTTASFSARWGEGKSPMAFPKRSDRRGSGSCGKRAPDWEAPASSLLRPRTSSLFLVAAWSRGDAICGSAPSPLRPYANSLRLRAFPAAAPCEQLAVAPSPLRPYASSLRPEASMLSSIASAPSRVSSFANT